MKKKRSFMNCYFQKKTKGFTLIELIVAMGISFIILSVIAFVIGMTGKTMDSNIVRRKLNNSGNYAVDYIEKEVRRSINIFSIDEFHIKPKENNLGFLLQVKPYQVNKNKYQYIYYYLEGRTLKRYSIGLQNSIDEGMDNKNIGTNGIAEKIASISKSYFNRDEKFIHLNFLCEDKGLEKEFESSIYAGVGNEN